jgi:uncharacterized damage-inducible protein DinB
VAEPPAGVLAQYVGWDDFQHLLAKAIAPLSAQQLVLRPAPHLRSVGENCLHIIGARARWCQLMGIGGERIAACAQWDRPDMPERSTAEIVSGLSDSWSVLRDALMSMTPSELDDTFPNLHPDPGEPDVFTRGWILWHLLEHDIFHGGEISLILGMSGVEGLGL